MKSVIDLMVAPSETIYRISRKEKTFQGFAALFLAVVSMSAGIALAAGYDFYMTLYSFTWGLIAKMAFWVFMVLLAASFYNFFAILLGGSGSPVQLFRILPYSLAPFCFAAPAALILKAYTGFWGLLFLAVIMFFMTIMVFYLQVRIMNYTYSLNSTKSVLVVVIPWCILYFVVFVLPFAAIMGALTI